MRRPARAIAFAVLLSLPPFGRGGEATPPLQSIEIVTSRGVLVFQVELAAKPAEIERGLKGRADLPDGTGMLFDFGLEVNATMSMKDTPVALDMIFIKADGRILRVAENQTPLLDRQIYSGGPVRGVLEVPGGTAHRLGIAPGDRVVHRIFGRAR